jgi:hypothetical protein
MERSCPTSGRPATPADINRNSRPTSIGTGGRHQSECPAGIIGIRNPADIAQRYGAETVVLDWRDRLVCSGCGSRNIDMVVTGTERRD